MITDYEWRHTKMGTVRYKKDAVSIRRTTGAHRFNSSDGGQGGTH